MIINDDKMNQISDAINEGANAYMKRQYIVVSIIGLIICAILYFVFGSKALFVFILILLNSYMPELELYTYS